MGLGHSLVLAELMQMPQPGSCLSCCQLSLAAKVPLQLQPLRVKAQCQTSVVRYTMLWHNPRAVLAGPKETLADSGNLAWPSLSFLPEGSGKTPRLRNYGITIDVSKSMKQMAQPKHNLAQPKTLLCIGKG